MSALATPQDEGNVWLDFQGSFTNLSISSAFLPQALYFGRS